ncbi:MAG: hypothetical protein AAGG02_16215 [Cyanobacteria bacterium P01_H01_bin.15]
MDSDQLKDDREPNRIIPLFLRQNLFAPPQSVIATSEWLEQIRSQPNYWQQLLETMAIQRAEH